MTKLWMTTGLVLWLAAGSLAEARPAVKRARPQHARASTPQHAKAGECYARVSKPPVYAARNRQVVERPAWIEIKIVPARTETVIEQVMVSPEVVERTWREPVYREDVRWESVPGPVRRVHEAAVYQEVRETVVTQPGRYEWQRQWDGRQEILCKVWVAPQQAVMVHKVLVSPARAYDVQGPPTKRQVVSKVLVSEGGWSERRTPAVYRSEHRLRVIQPERKIRIEHPAVYRSESSQVLIRPARQEWVRITCRKPAPRRHAPAPPPEPVYEDGERG